MNLDAMIPRKEVTILLIQRRLWFKSFLSMGILNCSAARSQLKQLLLKPKKDL